MPTCFYCLGNHDNYQCVKYSADRVASSTENIASSMEDIASRIEEQTSEISDAIKRSTNIISSHLSNIEDELGEINDSIQDLHSFLIWSHSEIKWRLEKQIEILTGISDMIKNPRATQADELYKMGIDSFKRNRLEDALKLLLEARNLNPGDYRVHITLGHIYVRKNNYSEAKECFQAGIDYARTNDYKGDALLLLCRVYRCSGNIELAINMAKKALLVAPNSSAAYYELASNIADKLKNTDLNSEK